MSVVMKPAPTRLAQLSPQTPKPLSHPRREMHPKQNKPWLFQNWRKPTVHPDYAPNGQTEKIDGYY
jgi:hypothetical protein